MSAPLLVYVRVEPVPAFVFDFRYSRHVYGLTHQFFATHAGVQDDTEEIGRLIGEIFRGTVTVLKEEEELRQFKKPH